MRPKISNFPFHSWVARPVGILILMFLFVPPTFSFGVNTSCIGEISGELGIQAEVVQLASFFVSIGMCLFTPFMVPFLQARRSKQCYIFCFIALIPLNYICGSTESVQILLAASLLTGFVRVIAMLNCTFTIAPYLTGINTLEMFTMKCEPSPEKQYSLERSRTFLMPALYFVILLIAQLSNMASAWFAYEFQWNDYYKFEIGLLLISVLIVIVTMQNENREYSYRIDWANVPDMIFLAIALCCISFVLIYGKTLDWLHSDRIIIATAVFLIASGTFLWSSSIQKKHRYFPIEVFKYRNVWLSMLLFLVSMIFNSASMFFGSYGRIGSGINNLQSAMLSKWAIFGCVIGLLLAIVLVWKKVKFSTLFFISFMLMAAGNAFMYFQYQTDAYYDNLALPIVLNYAGLLMLYSLVAAFGMKKLPSRYLATYVFLMIWMRNAIAPVVGTSVYSNWLDHRQQYYISRLAQNVDRQNYIADAQHSQAIIIGKASGKSELESEHFASISLKAAVVKQATISAMKDITGTSIVLLTGTAVITLLLPYHKKETT